MRRATWGGPTWSVFVQCCLVCLGWLVFPLFLNLELGPIEKDSRRKRRRGSFHVSIIDTSHPEVGTIWLAPLTTLIPYLTAREAQRCIIKFSDKKGSKI